MWPFTKNDNDPGRDDLYRDLADPSIPFDREAMYDLLMELIHLHQGFDVEVSHVPKDEFNRLTWNLYYDPGAYHNIWGNVHFWRDDIQVYLLTIKLSPTGFATRVGGLKMPIEFEVMGNESIFADGNDRWCVQYDKREKHALLANLLAGFFDTVLNILGRPSLRAEVKMKEKPFLSEDDILWEQSAREGVISIETY